VFSEQEDRMRKQTVVVGLSGGVDSSVAAKLLVDQGYSVIGVFMKNWEENGPECTAPQDARESEKIAQKLKIPFHTVNFSSEYWNEVFRYFLAENRKGRTPNPDILCNRYIKFGSFLQKAETLGADVIATGHYAKKREKNNIFSLCIPADTKKDQTYFLHALSQEQLKKTIFPLQDLQKSEVRDIARKAGFSTAEKKDSTGICFIGERNYYAFLRKYLKKNPGDFVDANTQKIVGQHAGLSFYTIGQRKNLKIGGIKGYEEKPWFVIAKDTSHNTIIVSQDEQKLESRTLCAQNLTWISGKQPNKTFNCTARIRYRSEKVSCFVKMRNAVAYVEFDTPVRAITPGQSVVFYHDDICLGGGEIV
jgi:tRNA-specific 2-thiouridylase